jgi:hypothetical protein
VLVYQSPATVNDECPPQSKDNMIRCDILYAPRRGRRPKPLPRVLSTRNCSVSDKVVQGVGGARIIGKQRQDFTLSVGVCRSSPVCAAFGLVSGQGGDNVRDLPRPSREIKSALANKLWPDLIMQPHPVSDENPV